MQGKIQKFEGLTPFEEEHAQQQTNEEWLAKLAKRQYLTRGQWWHGYGRRVTVPNADARKTIVTQSGRTLFLFSADQLLPEQEQGN
jgi:hypothetical protein